MFSWNAANALALRGRRSQIPLAEKFVREGAR
jgi:hypothetical protein